MQPRAIGPALQSVGISQGYYLFGAVPYVLTLVVLVISCRPGKVAQGGAPVNWFQRAETHKEKSR